MSSDATTAPPLADRSVALSAEDEFARFVRARWNGLVRTAYLLCGDHGLAEDLVQDVLVKLHRHWRRLGSDDPVNYCRRAVANEAISRRRRRRVTELLIDPPTGAAKARGDAYARIDARDEVLWALQQLPPRMRAVLVLRYFDDLSEAETAATLAMSTGTAKSHASRGVRRLRELLDAAGGESPDPKETDR